MRASLALSLALLACRPQPAPRAPEDCEATDATPTTAPASAPATAPASLAARVEPLLVPGTAPTYGAPIEFQTTPGIPEFTFGLMDHAHDFGWSADGSEFGYCSTSSGSAATTCEFVRLDGTRSRFSTYSAEEGSDTALYDELQRLLAKKGIALRPATWAFPEVVISWQEHSTKDRASLWVTAAVGDAAPVYLATPVHENFYTTHPDAFALSPDGETLAILTHAFAGEFSDTFALTLAPVRSAVSRAYQNAGLAKHKAGSYEEAARHFHKAAHAYPSYGVPMYNLACALARLGDPATEAALRLAFASIEESIAETAAIEPDLESVRHTAWFRELTHQAQ